MTTSGGTRTSSSAWRGTSSLRRAARRAAAQAVCAIYPPRCILCGADLDRAAIVCPACEAGLEPLDGPRCERCGDAVDDPLLDLCPACGTGVRSFDRIVSLGRYDAGWGALVRALKFDREKAVARYLGERLAAAANGCGFADDTDLVTFVPMTRADRRARGFNQSKLLAAATARRLRRPLRRTLRKVRRTPPQGILGAAARRGNLRGAYRSVRYGNGRVLLVDDTCTTASTADACAEALRGAGYASVRVLTVARA